MIQLKLICMGGLGYQCESEEIEGAVGRGQSIQEAIQQFLVIYELLFDVDRETIKYKWS